MNKSIVPLLNPAQLDQARTLLMQRRQALLSAATEHRGGSSRVEAALETLENLRGEDDAQIDEVRDFAQMLSTREQEELMAVDAALARLGEGHYGECTVCGSAVGWPRLQAQPEAPRCIGCQAAEEADERRRA